MPDEPFIRYMVNGASSILWHVTARPMLEKRGWIIMNPSNFSYEESYGFNARLDWSGKPAHDFEYCRRNATAIVEYRGEPPKDSVFNLDSDRTVVDDLLAFMSLYSGEYFQYLWKEANRPASDQSISLKIPLKYHRQNEKWAGVRSTVPTFFERALTIIPDLDSTQFNLAIHWFFSALREFEVGRPLIEAALNWVCLESQANCLGLPGNDVRRVEQLLKNQGFPQISLLGRLYGLRSNAFHQGQLSNLSETDAPLIRTAGRTLVRAQILNLLGMNHSDFNQEFVKQYAS